MNDPFSNDDDYGFEPPSWPQAVLIAVLMAVLFGLAAMRAIGAEVISYRVIDGDTIEASLMLEFGYPARAETFRLHQFDAWESRRIRKSLKLTPAQWDVEIPKGKAASAALSKLLAEAKVIELREVKTLRSDPWGRGLADLYVDGKLAADILRAQGHERTKP